MPVPDPELAPLLFVGAGTEVKLGGDVDVEFVDDDVPLGIVLIALAAELVWFPVPLAGGGVFATLVRVPLGLEKIGKLEADPVAVPLVGVAPLRRSELNENPADLQLSSATAEGELQPKKDPLYRDLSTYRRGSAANFLPRPEPLRWGGKANSYNKIAAAGSILRCRNILAQAYTSEAICRSNLSSREDFPGADTDRCILC